MSSRVSRGLALGATSTAFSLRAAGRVPISKAKDGTAGSQATDHAFRTPEPAQPPALAPRGRPRNSLFGGEQGEASHGAGRAIPCSARKNRELRSGRAAAARDSLFSREEQGIRKWPMKTAGMIGDTQGNRAGPARRPADLLRRLLGLLDALKPAGRASRCAACRRRRDAGPRPPR